MSDVPQEVDPSLLDQTLLEAVIGRVVTEAAAEVLETMFFLAAEERNAADRRDQDPAAPSRVSASLQFSGYPSGAFWISVTEGVARELDASLLGRDASEVSAEEAGQAVGELANIVCGLVLSRLESEVIFRLSAPTPGVPLQAAGSRSYRAAFDLDAGDVLLSFDVEHEFDRLPGGYGMDEPFAREAS